MARYEKLKRSNSWRFSKARRSRGSAEAASELYLARSSLRASRKLRIFFCITALMAGVLCGGNFLDFFAGTITARHAVHCVFSVFECAATMQTRVNWKYYAKEDRKQITT